MVRNSDLVADWGYRQIAAEVLIRAILDYDLCVRKQWVREYPEVEEWREQREHYGRYKTMRDLLPVELEEFFSGDDRATFELLLDVIDVQLEAEALWRKLCKDSKFRQAVAQYLRATSRNVEESNPRR